MIDPQAEAFTLKEEGGRKPPGPGDPNPTQFGITQVTYTEWLSRHGLPSRNIYDITEQARHAIYQEYWERCSGDDVYAISPELSLLHFDNAFNAGPPEANKILQQTVDTAQDGAIGLITLSAVQRLMVSEPRATLMAYLQNRWDFLQELHNFPQWGRGWRRRLNACAIAVGVDWQAV